MWFGFGPEGHAPRAVGRDHSTRWEVMFKPLIQEIDSMMARDPAARSRLEVILCYPGFQAFAFYRLSRWLWRRKWTLPARLVSQIARWLTGIEIHPGAEIGRNLFIEHCMGGGSGETR